MNKPIMIAHAAQDADPNEPGFVHAVALAVQSGARLTSVHACAAGAPELDLPTARTLLSRWGLAEDRAPHARVSTGRSSPTRARARCGSRACCCP